MPAAGRTAAACIAGLASGASRDKSRRDAREAEGAPLLREYRVKSLIEGSNPSLSATSEKTLIFRVFLCLRLALGNAGKRCPDLRMRN